MAAPTLVGSYLSILAAGSVFICYLILPPQKHFRHTLIMNLAGAGFFNALNNSISGTYVMVNKRIPEGSACTINGWIGQLTVQATDFTIFFIAIATVITLWKRNYKPRTDKTTKRIITCCIWIVPLATSSTGLYMDAYRPVSGNWCWLKAKPTILRYALGHNWRLTIIFFTICLYTYLFIYIHRHFASLRSSSSPNDNRNTSEQTSESSGESGLSGITIYEEFEIVDEPFDAWWDVQIPTSEMEYFDLSPPRPNDSKEAATSPPPAPLEIIKQNFHPYAQTGSNRPNETTPFLKTRDPLAIVRRPPPPHVSTTIQVTPSVAATLWSREMDIQKLLLLNAYPIGYIILWIPGIANRFVELSGHRVRGLAIAQASTQFVGLANALHLRQAPKRHTSAMTPTPAAESPHILFELSADHPQTINIDGLLVILALWGKAEGLTLSSRDTIIAVLMSLSKFLIIMTVSISSKDSSEKLWPSPYSPTVTVSTATAVAQPTFTQTRNSIQSKPHEIRTQSPKPRSGSKSPEMAKTQGVRSRESEEKSVRLWPAPYSKATAEGGEGGQDRQGDDRRARTDDTPEPESEKGHVTQPKKRFSWRRLLCFGRSK
ncbi:G protein-coupled glucose receptor regulating Gpa2-domain-containing protein [Leptodontidium sp. 2 PMI_412]|nr:G protein-coupled glucose receptor regulating Gpa2-domain-containing protein [Leptodontidium sp. 2 PMI_412]